MSLASPDPRSLRRAEAAPTALPHGTLPVADEPEPIITSTAGRYFAFDVRSRFISDSGRLEELATLYADVFNHVEAVPEKWSYKSAMHMVESRLRKPGCNIALVDVEDGEKVIGAFFANIVPGANGWNLTEPDILVKEQYRKLGLGREVGWVGRNYANQLCVTAVGEGLVENHSKTYLEPTFPKGKWEEYGYKIEPLYVQNASVIGVRSSGSVPAVHIKGAEENDLPEIAAFIADFKNTKSSDKSRWSLPRAMTFARFMHKYNYSTYYVAKRDGKIIAVSSGDVMPGRKGPILVDARCFVKTDAALEAADMGNLSSNNVANASFYKLFAAADGVSRDKLSEAISTIEIPKHSESFFRNILPELTEDTVFAGMNGDHRELEAKMAPTRANPLITLVRHNGKPIVG